ncbi:MAG: anthranilate phosphoribosyltransferase [Bacteriovoracaceae bacterium]|nr:anthranilate phosphoribosyltransferase [Bacteroidota bacterium]
MLQEAIHKLVEKTDLTKQETYECVLEIMSGTASETLISAFLTALRMKGEVVPEIAGAALAMREKSTKIITKHSHVIDTCGTGGDGLGTFNISTASALVAASAGAIVAKHGNRAISSKCGSADVLNALGVNIDIPKEKVEICLDEIGIGFLFAQMLHSAMKYAAPVRRELGMRTIFNVLGPLTNPAGAKRQVLGVFRRGLTEILANVLLDLGTERALIVHGNGGMDEISTIGETRMSEIKDGKVTTFTFHHHDVGIPTAELSAVGGGDAAENAGIIRSILSGKKGAPKDIVVVNAGAAIYVSGKAASIVEGVHIANDMIESGTALRKLNDLVEFTNA